MWGGWDFAVCGLRLREKGAKRGKRVGERGKKGQIAVRRFIFRPKKGKKGKNVRKQ